jgi:hypothetical protein
MKAVCLESILSKIPIYAADMSDSVSRNFHIIIEKGFESLNVERWML